MLQLIGVVLYGFMLTGTCPNCTDDGLSAYAEDLSAHRTLFVAPPIETYKPLSVPKHKSSNTHFTVSCDITSRLQQLLLDLKAYHEMTKSIAGYTIQGYNGTSRQLAFQIKDQLCAHFDYLNAEVQYKQPNFTVQIGRFLDQLEAYPLYLRIKKFLPQAIIRPAWFPNKAGIFEWVKPIEVGNSPLDGEKQACNEETKPVEDLAVDQAAD
jgi:hypothetical protein